MGKEFGAMIFWIWVIRQGFNFLGKILLDEEKGNTYFLFCLERKRNKNVSDDWRESLMIN